jgi:hypothetical protein
MGGTSPKEKKMEHVGNPQIVYIPKPEPRRYPVQIPQRREDEKPIPVVIPRRERVPEPVVPQKEEK